MRHQLAMLPMIALVIIFALLAPADSLQANPTALTQRTMLPLILSAQNPQLSEEQFIAQQVQALVNHERAQAGCDPLALDPRLTQAAQGHSHDMALSNYFAHVGPDGSNLVSRVAATSYRYRALAENLAAGYQTPEAVVAGWMESPGHRRNLINCTYTQLGVGYTFQADDAPLADGGGPYRYYWTQVLGLPSDR